MNRSTLRIAIIVLTLITAGVHLAFGLAGLFGGDLGGFTIPFVLNGLGYLSLLAALFMDVPFFRDNRPLAHWLLIGFAALTLILYFVFNGFSNFGPAAIITKGAELLLIIATYMHLRAAH